MMIVQPGRFGSSIPGVFLLDAGDSACYGGSGVTLSNLVGSPTDGSAQSAYNFKRGDGATSTTYPTFNGSAGGLSSSEYFSFDGGDYLSLSGANTTFLNSLHKDNAAFTIMMVVYPVTNSGAVRRLFTTGGAPGIDLRQNTADGLQFVSWDNGGSPVLNKNTDGTLTLNAYQFIALSVDEAGNGFFAKNSSYMQVSSANTWTAAYTGPSTSSAAETLTLCNLSLSGTRLPWAALRSTALPKAEVDAVYNSIKARWSI